MFSARRRARFQLGAASLAVFATIAFAPPAAAADPTHACVEAAHEGQRLRDAGQLSAGRAELLRCAVDTCPDVVRDSCTRWMSEIDARLPTIVLGARDEGRADVAAVRVTIDGKVVAEVLDGRSLPIDPGPHTIVFEARGRAPLRQFVIVREGEKVRPITAVFSVAHPAAPPPTTRDARSPDLVPPLVSGAIAIAGLASFAVFGILGQSEKSHLEDTCAAAQTCASADVSGARTKLVVADVSLVVGLAAAVVTGVFLMREPWRARASAVSVAPSIGGFRPGVAARPAWLALE